MNVRQDLWAKPSVLPAEQPMRGKLKKETGKVYVLLSDGEIQEGQAWEAFQAASFYHLDNLVVYVDVNGQQVEGYTKDVMNIEPLAARLEAFGAKTAEVDGMMCRRSLTRRVWSIRESRWSFFARLHLPRAFRCLRNGSHSCILSALTNRKWKSTKAFVTRCVNKR